jgi:hypothetical protein
MQRHQSAVNRIVNCSGSSLPTCFRASGVLIEGSIAVRFELCAD